MKTKSLYGDLKALTADELENINDMDEVVVIWRGGNGPCEYVAKWIGAGLFVYVPGDMRRPVGCVYNKTNKFVLDQVWAEPHEVSDG